MARRQGPRQRNAVSFPVQGGLRDAGKAQKAKRLIRAKVGELALAGLLAISYEELLFCGYTPGCWIRTARRL